jgi:hypothetical protein
MQLYTTLLSAAMPSLLAFQKRPVPLERNRPVTKKASSDLSRRKLSVSLCFDRCKLHQAAKTIPDKSGQKRTFFPDYERKTGIFRIESIILKV